MGGGAYIPSLRIAGFLALVWGGSRTSRIIGLSSIIAEISIGVVFGPQVLELIPKQYAICEADYSCDGDSVCLMDSHTTEECNHYPDMFTLIGQFGVALMIFESGMHFSFEKAKKVGMKAMLVAIIGTLLPVACGVLFTMLLGMDHGWTWKHGLAVGISLAPTSVGIALKLLNETKQLNEDFGQAILISAFTDDILSIILFSVIFPILDPESDFDFVKSVLPSIGGVIFVFVGLMASVSVWPRICDVILRRAPDGVHKHFKPRDATHLLLMFSVLVAYASACNYLGSHLLGCFVAGISFANVDRSHFVWDQQTKRITTWMIRIFFACSVAFVIPINKLFDPDALWKGLVMGAIPCIGTKLVSAFFMGKSRWVIGWAMVGRAEFAYLIAQLALTKDLLGKGENGEALFAVLIWALVWSTVITPIAFKHVLIKHKRRMHEEQLAAKIEEDINIIVKPRESIKMEEASNVYRVRIVAPAHAHIEHDMSEVLWKEGLNVVEAHFMTDEQTVVGIFVVRPIDSLSRGVQFDNQTMGRMRGEIQGALQGSRVIFRPFADEELTACIKTEIFCFDQSEGLFLEKLLSCCAPVGITIQRGHLELHEGWWFGTLHFKSIDDKPVFADEVKTDLSLTMKNANMDCQLVCQSGNDVDLKFSIPRPRKDAVHESRHIILRNIDSPIDFNTVLGLVSSVGAQVTRVLIPNVNEIRMTTAEKLSQETIHRLHEMNNGKCDVIVVNHMSHVPHHKKLSSEVTTPISDIDVALSDKETYPLPRLDISGAGP